MVGAGDRGHRQTWLPAALMVLAACGGGSSTPEAASSDDETLEAPEDVEGTTADPRLVPVCDSVAIFDDITALFEDLPADPTQLESAIDAIAVEIDTRLQQVPSSMFGDLDELADWFVAYDETWERYDYDIDQVAAATTDPFALILGVGSQLAEFGSWVALADAVCVDDYAIGCAELNLTAARCECVEQAFVSLAVDTGLPRAPDGALDFEPVTEPCPDSVRELIEGWCGSTAAITEARDFPSTDFGSAAEATEELASGNLTSQEEPVTDFVATADAFAAAAPDGVAPLAQELASWVDDYGAVWAEADYAYANILNDPPTSDRYLALIDDERRARTVPALIALEETLCDGADSFTGGCVVEGGTQDRCECVWGAIASAVLYDGVPLSVDGTIDVEAATASCDR